MSKFYLLKHLCEFHALGGREREGGGGGSRKELSFDADLNKCLQNKIRERKKKRRQHQHQNEREYVVVVELAQCLTIVLKADTILRNLNV